MLVYAMLQELATGLTYRNLQRHVEQQGDPALFKLLGYLSVDEQAHHAFFLKAVQLFLEEDRTGTLRQLRTVLDGFAMPAIHSMVDGRRRVQAVEAMHLFDARIFHQCVYQPILTTLGITRAELRRCDWH
jgi:hypothetical protein